jgi:hypothetical protein
MRSATRHPSISAVRADALFASPVQRSDEPSAAQIQQAITAAIRAFGVLGCAAQVGHAYGDHPEIAATRMRWARAAVGGSRPESAPGPILAQCTAAGDSRAA